MAKNIALGLLLASLALLIIYGADVMAATMSDDSLSERRGFLPFNEAIRGGAFGGGAVVMSIVGFIIARKERVPAVAALLFVNGGLIVAGMLALIAQGALSSGDSSDPVRTIGSTMALGALLVGLGGWKAAGDRRAISPTHKEPSPK